ncbi:MAG: hypothetical protein UY09_C0052G0003 [Parcubacteria group bacterium GW2011_GWA2_47_8]|nr:MAG: hypothetical protein UY09_C0052G0003 [Parcubacteria group bacterium GW2011_GWA2_47_8]
MDNVIGIKQLYTELKSITQRVNAGETFLVMNHTKPAFRIEPTQPNKTPQHTLRDLAAITFRGPKDLSKSVDSVVYHS